MIHVSKYPVLCLAALSLGLGTSASASISASTLPEFSGNYYDSTLTYPLAPVTIGTFTFTVPTGETITNATVSGTFGNSSVNSTTLETLYLGGIQVASCSSTSDPCFDPATPFDAPTTWSYTFNPAQLAIFYSGSVDFTVVQNGPFQVQEGATTLNVEIPEPPAILLFGGILAALALRGRRFRKYLPGLLTVLAVPSIGHANVTTWTALTSPVEATIKGGPWSLGQNGSSPVTPTGPNTYCVGGTPLVNTPTIANTFSPYYFPFVIGKGQNMQGYFDYRPRNINEATVAAKSTDGGLTWQFQQMAEQLTTACPTDNVNSSGDDSGQGHPYMLSFGGTSWLYLLDRRTGHIDSDGLLVHRLPSPSASHPMGNLPLTSALYSYTLPPTSATIARWDFDGQTGVQNTPATSIGTGSAKSLGMTNSYTYTQTAPNVGSVATCDITATSGSSDTGTNGTRSWRVRGANPGNGWNLAAPQYSQGAEFDVSTVGYSNIALEFDWYTTAQAVRDLQVQYTTDGSTWINVGPVQVALQV